MKNVQATPVDWFISDMHFGHENVLTHCNRPFANMDAQDGALIAGWNDCVKPGDRVYVIGDFSFYKPNKTSEILHALNGQKILIKGNHDHSKDLAKVRGWMEIVTYKEIRIHEDRICMSHFPMLVWNQSHRGAYHLHGHSHGSCKYPDQLKDARIFDVGVDNLFKLTGLHQPVAWYEIQAYLDGRGHYSLDHHQIKPRKEYVELD